VVGVRLGWNAVSYEPSANAFYRKVELLTRPGGVEYVLVTNTQFLTSATTSAQAGRTRPQSRRLLPPGTTAKTPWASTSRSHLRSE
jgi:hypothetical protein